MYQAILQCILEVYSRSQNFKDMMYYKHLLNDKITTIKNLVKQTK